MMRAFAISEDTVPLAETGSGAELGDTLDARNARVRACLPKMKRALSSRRAEKRSHTHTHTRADDDHHRGWELVCGVSSARASFFLRKKHRAEIAGNFRVAEPSFVERVSKEQRRETCQFAFEFGEELETGLG